MQRFRTLFGQWAAVVMAGAAMASAPAFAQAVPLRASGTDYGYTYFKGNQFEGTTSGRAQPGGQFTGAYTGTDTGQKAVGVEIWTFTGGDTLTFAWEVQPVDKSHNVWAGTYVVTGGTGRFEGATGSADYLWTAHGDGTADFAMEGTINLR
jgi:hypothetical protein